MSPIYAITPDKPLNIKNIENVLKRYNITILQYRRKIKDNNIKNLETKQLVVLCNKLKVQLIINDDVQLAKKIGCGVHLGKNDIDIISARNILGEKAIIGVSCYNDINLAKKFEKLGVSYCGFGSIFPSTTKPNASVCDLDTIIKAKQELKIPIVAIGGINFDNCPKVYNAGADSVAMISALW